MTGLLLASGGAHSQGRQLQAIKVGIVPQFTVQHIREIWDPILLSVARQANVRFVFVGSPDIPQFEKKLLKGEFDLVYLNPYHMLMANEARHYQPLVRDVRRSLRGILVVRKDSGIVDLSQIQGKVVAYPAPNALGASLLMRAELANLRRIETKPRYVKTHSSSYLNVFLGRVVAAGGIMKTFNKQPANIRNALRIIYETRRVPSHPIAIHPRIDEATRHAIQTALLALGESPDGRAMLARVPIYAIGRASMAEYLKLKNLGLDKFVAQE